MPIEFSLGIRMTCSPIGRSAAAMIVTSEFGLYQKIAAGPWRGAGREYGRQEG
jgi:hypothetical protein